METTMYLQHEYRTGRKWVARLPFEADLLQALEEFAKEQGIRVGYGVVIGAVKKAMVGFYDQHQREYNSLEFDEPLEILHCTGNLSMRDGVHKVHMHLTLGNSYGFTVGGHLMPGTIVFAGEAVIEELGGPELNRGYDGQTGLPLWEK